MAAPLTYRPYRPSDFPAVARLWADEAGWGELTPQTWREWFEETPHGPCLVLVAAAGGEVVGQIVFTPSVLGVGGRAVPAARMSAPIVRREYRVGSLRSLSLLHPVVMLWVSGSIAAAARGWKLVYALPEHAWLPLFRSLGRFSTAEYGCLTLPLSEAAAAPPGWAARPAAAFGPDHESLWAAARDSFPIRCGVERTADWLRYRNAGHLAIDVRSPSDGGLAGYVCVNRKSGLFMDVVARTPAELGPMLASAVKALLPGGGVAPVPFESVQAMDTPPLGPVLREVGFRSADFRFALVVDALDPNLDPAAIAPEAWYPMPSD